MMVWMYFLSFIFVLGMAINVSRKEEQELIEEQNRLEQERLEQVRLKKEKKELKKAQKEVKETKKKDS